MKPLRFVGRFFCWLVLLLPLAQTEASADSSIAYSISFQGNLSATSNAANNTGALGWQIKDSSGTILVSGNLNCNRGSSSSGNWTGNNFVPGKPYTISLYLLPGCSGSISAQVQGLPGATASSVSANNPSTTQGNGTWYNFPFSINLPLVASPGQVPDLTPSYLAAGTSTSLGQDKVFWYVGLGRLRDGTPAGVVGFREPAIDPNVFTPFGLYQVSTYPVIDHEVDLVYSNLALRQVYTREVLVDIQTVSSTSYRMNIYDRATSSVVQPGGAGTLCSFSGSPFVSYTVSQIAATGGIDITRTEGGVIWETTLSQSNNTWTLNDWHKQGGQSSQIVTAYASPTAATVTVTGPASGLSAQVPGYADTAFSWTKNYLLNGTGQYVLAETKYGASETTPVTTDYTYYTSSNATSGAYLNLIQSVINPDSTWKTYTYYVGSGPADTTIPDGQVKVQYHPWLDNRAGTSAATAAASPSTALDAYDTYTYTYLQKGQGSSQGPVGSMWMPSSRVSCAPGGTVIGHTTWNYNPFVQTLNGFYVWSQTQNDFSDATHSLSTTSEYYVPSVISAPNASYLDNKCVSTVFPSGKKDSYAYITGTWNPTTLTFAAGSGAQDRLVLCFHGRVSAGSVAGVSYVNVSSWTNGGTTWSLDPLYMEASRSNISESVIDTSGRTVFVGQDVFLSATSMARVAGTQNVYDSHGRLTNSIDVMRSVSGNSYQTQFSYSGLLVSSVTAPDGIVTSYQYDDLLRTTTKTVGVGGPALYPAQTLTTIYDGAGRPVSAMNAATAPTIYYYDTAGRVIQKTEASPNSGSTLNTLCAFTSPTSTTVTLPTGATTIKTAYLDGSPKSVSGTAQPPRFYTYSANATGMSTTITNATTSDQSQGWSITQADLLGRTITQSSPATGWTSSNNNTIKTTANYDPSTGLLNSQSIIYNATGALLSPNHLYVYDAGRLIQDGLDLDNSGTLVAASNDRITLHDNYLAQDSSGWRAIVTTSTYPTLNASTTLALSTVATRLTGFNGGSAGPYGIVTTDVSTTDVNGQTARQIESVSPSLLRHHLATTLPGIANVAYSETINGYASQSQAASGAVGEIEYDTLGRPVTTHSRWNGSSFAVADTTTYFGSTSYPATQVTSGISTSYAYAWGSPSGTRMTTVTDALGNASYTLYNAMGLPFHIGGSATSPVQYNYDSLGRVYSQTTWRSGNYTEANWPTSGGDTTTKTIEAATGLVTSKIFADSNHVDFTYTPLGQTATRKWARQVTTTYNYFDGSTTPLTDVSNLTQELRSVTYSDGTTPTVSYTYNRLGTPATVSDVIGSRSFAYDPAQPGRVTTENLSGYYNNQIETQKYDSVFRPAGFQLGTSSVPGAALSQLIGYDPTGGLPSTLTTSPSGQTARTFTYSYLNNQLLSGYSTPVSGGNYAVGYSYQPNSNLRSSVQNIYGSTVVAQYDLNYNSSGQIQSTRQSGSAFADYYNSSYSSVINAYNYDAMGQIQKAALYRGSTTPAAPSSADELPGHHFEFRYDAMGNRTSAGETGLVPPATGGTDDSFTPNSLNQYSAKTNYAARVVGTVGTSSTLTVAVNGAAQTRKVDRVWSADLVPSQGSSAGTGTATVYSAIPGNLSTPDIVRADNSKKWFLPPFNQSFTYDADGNLKSDQLWSYSYDAENRLISMNSLLPANFGFTRWNISFQYDYLNRRIQKSSVNLDDSSQNRTSKFLYNGWNMVAELDSTGATLQRSYTWGLDLTGSFTASGGVGALLQMTDHTANKNYFPGYDQNGNVASIERDNGVLAAAFEYSPFGELMRNDILDPVAANFPFQFSTKFTDLESGLAYYGYRYYSAGLGRFINKDPIGEAGGANLYGFSGNNGVSGFDVLGMDSGPSSATYQPAQPPPMTDSQRQELNAYYAAVYGIPGGRSGLQITTLDNSWVYLTPSNLYSRTYVVNGVTYVVTNDPNSVPSNANIVAWGNNYGLNSQGQVVRGGSNAGRTTVAQVIARSASDGGSRPDPGSNAGTAAIGGGTTAASAVLGTSSVGGSWDEQNAAKYASAGIPMAYGNAGDLDVSKLEYRSSDSGSWLPWSSPSDPNSEGSPDPGPNYASSDAFAASGNMAAAYARSGYIGRNDNALFMDVVRDFHQNYAAMANVEPRNQFVFGSKEVHTPGGTTSELIGIAGVEDKKLYLGAVGGIGKGVEVPLGALGKIGVTYVPAGEYTFNGGPPVLDQIVEINLGPIGIGGYKTGDEKGGFVYRNVTSTTAVGLGFGW